MRARSRVTRDTKYGLGTVKRKWPGCHTQSHATVRIRNSFHARSSTVTEKLVSSCFKYPEFLYLGVTQQNYCTFFFLHNIYNYEKKLTFFSTQGFYLYVFIFVKTGNS